MRLVTFGDDARAGVVNEHGEVVDLGAVAVQALVADWGRRRDEVAAAARRVGIPIDQVRLRAPIRPRNNVMCVGKNYVDHAREFAGSGFDASAQRAVPDFPVIFTKALSSIADPVSEAHVSADATGTSDYEGELGVVLDGDGGVFGYTVINDLTVREVQRRHVQFFLGKSAPGYCPMGPVLLTADEVADPRELRVVTLVNGEVRQDASVAQMIFGITTLLDTVGAAVAVEPGDVIATGTPAGVGIGFDPPRYLTPGDVVEVRIDPIGSLRTTCH